MKPTYFSSLRPTSNVVLRNAGRLGRKARLPGALLTGLLGLVSAPTACSSSPLLVVEGGGDAGTDSATPTPARDANILPQPVEAGTLDASSPSPATDGGSGGGGGIREVAKLDDEPIAVSVIGSTVYAALFDDGIVSIPAAGGAVTSVVASVQQGDFFQNPFFYDAETRGFYFSESSGGGGTSPIAYASLDNAKNPSILASSEGFTSALVQNADTVYWVDQDSGTVNAIPIDGGGHTATTLASGLSTPAGLVFTGDTLYLTDAAGDLLALSATGGTVKKLVTGAGLPGNTGVADWSPPLATDGSHIYYTSNCFGDAANRKLVRVNLDGTGAITLANTCASGLALDGDTLYWADGTTVNAVPTAGGVNRVIASAQQLSAGPAVDGTDVYWGVTIELSCGVCPPPAADQANAIMAAPKTLGE